MELAWVNKLVEGGQISKQAAEIIHKDVNTVLDSPDLVKEAGLSNWVDLSSPSGVLLLGLATSLGTAGIIGGASTIAAHAEHSAFDAKTKAIKDKIVNNPSLDPKAKEKAEARFNEIVRFAPSLAGNEAVMTRMVNDKLHSGLSDRDVQNLVSIQAKFTPNAMQYSQMSEKTAEEVAGEALADKYIQFEKDASVSGLVAKLGPIAKPVKDMFLTTVAPMMLIGAGISGVRWIDKKIDEKKLKSRLEDTYTNIMISSKDDVLGENPQKAREAFNTLAHFAPHVAVEPTSARAFMTKLVAYGVGPNASDLKDITEIEKNIGGSSVSKDKGVMELVGMPHLMSKTIEDISEGSRRDLVSHIETKRHPGMF